MYHLTDNIIVLERHDWNARKPGGMTAQPHAPTEAFIHHGAEKDADARSITTLDKVKSATRGIQAFHMGPERGWSDIGYHYVVFQPHGKLEHAVVAEARMVRYVPAAQQGHNTGTLAVCVYGTIDSGDKLQDNTVYAIAQLIGGRRSNLTGATNIKTVGGHRDVTDTECPGATLYGALDRIARDAGVRRHRK
jgi:hypothetical protein